MLDFIGDTYKNFISHCTKWLSHTRMGGLLVYRSTEFDEFIKLNRIYKQIFLQEENNQDINSTLLDIDWEKNKPRAQEGEILAGFNFDGKKRNGGQINNEMSNISSLIKFCVNNRFEAVEARGYNHINGAVVLFCAEFCQWANATAKRNIDEKLLDDIKERIEYLCQIEEEGIFKNEPKADYSINCLIFNLRNMLEKKVCQKILAEINRQTSREFFGSLSKNAEDFFFKYQ